MNFRNYVRLGVQNSAQVSYFEQQLLIERGIPHENYDELSKNREFDIALIILVYGVEFTGKLICN